MPLLHDCAFFLFFVFVLDTFSLLLYFFIKLFLLNQFLIQFHISTVYQFCLSLFSSYLPQCFFRSFQFSIVFQLWFQFLSQFSLSKFSNSSKNQSIMFILFKQNSIRVFTARKNLSFDEKKLFSVFDTFRLLLYFVIDSFKLVSYSVPLFHCA